MYGAPLQMGGTLKLRFPGAPTPGINPTTS